RNVASLHLLRLPLEVERAVEPLRILPARQQLRDRLDGMAGGLDVEGGVGLVLTKLRPAGVAVVVVGLGAIGADDLDAAAELLAQRVDDRERGRDVGPELERRRAVAVTIPADQQLAGVEVFQVQRSNEVVEQGTIERHVLASSRWS